MRTWRLRKTNSCAPGHTTPSTPGLHLVLPDCKAPVLPCLYHSSSIIGQRLTMLLCRKVLISPKELLVLTLPPALFSVLKCLTTGSWQRPYAVGDFIIHQPPLRGFPGGTSGKEPACLCRRLKRPRFDSWEEGMATHSSVLAWEISCTVNPKGNQPWIFIGRSDAEVPILWSPDVKSWFNRKDPDAGKDWRWEEQGATKDEMVGWDRWLNGYEFEQGLRDSEGQGSLAWCSPWGCRQSDMI